MSEGRLEKMGVRWRTVYLLIELLIKRKTELALAIYCRHESLM
jgi:hypothetical protein